MRCKPIPAVPAEAADRFWAKVDRTGSCWLFRGQLTRSGYGTVFHNKGRYFAHRFAWTLANGHSVPSDKIVCHACDNPRCVNPSHLWLGEHRDNARDMVSKGRCAATARTHCSNGHEFTTENTYFTRPGHRACRACHAARSNVRYHSKKAAQQ